MRKIKVIQIGIGHDHAIDIFNNILFQNSIFELSAIAVPDSEKDQFEERLKLCTNIHKIPRLCINDALNLPGIEAAIIETEEKNLTKYALMAADKGLHIHMDKPGGFDLASFEKLINILKSKNLILSLGYMYRFNPLISEAIKKAEAGRLGEIYGVEAHMDCEHIPQKRQWLEMLPGGMMFFLGCHLTDLIYRLQGEPTDIIPLNCSTSYKIKNAQDFGMTIFKYPHGISFAKTCAAEIGGFSRRQLVICGTKGTIEIRPLESFVSSANNRVELYSEMNEIYSDNSNGSWHSERIKKRSETYDRYDAMMQNFVQRINGRKENIYTYDYELNLYKLILKTCGIKLPD